MKRAALWAALVLATGCTPSPESPTPESAVAAPAQAPVAPEPVAEPEPVDPLEPEPEAPVDPAVAWENRLGNLPPDAAAVIRRVEACNRFSAMDLSTLDATDRVDAEQTIADLRCNDLAQDTADLQKEYTGRPDVLEALDMANRGVR